MQTLKPKIRRERRGVSNVKPMVFFLLEVTIVSQILFFFYIANEYVFYVLIPIAIGYVLVSPLPRLTDIYRRIDKVKMMQKDKKKRKKEY